MVTVLDLIGIQLDNFIYLEIIFIGVVLALIGAGGYVLFVSSMKDDRSDKRRSRSSNPWEQLSAQKGTSKPKDDAKGDDRTN